MDTSLLPPLNWICTFLSVGRSKGRDCILYKTSLLAKCLSMDKLCFYVWIILKCNAAALKTIWLCIMEEIKMNALKPFSEILFPACSCCCAGSVLPGCMQLMMLGQSEKVTWVRWSQGLWAGTGDSGVGGKQDLLLSSTLPPWRSLVVSFLHLCFIFLSLWAKRCCFFSLFLKEELSCKELQNRQELSALLNSPFTLQLSTAQCMKWRGCCGAPNLLFQHFTPISSKQRAFIHP